MRKIVILNIGSIAFVLIFFAFSGKMLFFGDSKNIKLALKAQKEQKYEVAIQYYRAELDENPANAMLWERISELEINLNNYNSAANALNHAIALHPNDPKLYMKLSEIYGVAKEPEKAMAAIEGAIKLEPDDISFLIRKADLARWLLDYSLAETAYQKILALDPNNEVAKIGLENLQKEIAESKEYRNIPKAGLQAEMREEWQLAIAIYTQTINENPNSPYNLALWIRMYNIQNTLKEYNNAIFSIKEAIKLDPNNINLYEQLSESYGVIGDLPKALDTVNQGLTINPNNEFLLKKKLEISKFLSNSISGSVPSAIPAQGLVYEGEKKWAEAIQVYKTEIAKNPKDPKNYDIWLRIVEINNYLKDYEQSAQALKEAITFKPQEVSLYIKLAEIYGQLKKTKEAFFIIELALKIEPSNIDLLKNYAILANVLELLDIVKETYCRILGLEPYNKDALIGLANLKIKQNHLDAAVADYRNILALYPKTPTAWLDYVKLESWRGNFSNAFAGLESYRYFFGMTKEYYEVRARLFAMANYAGRALCDVEYLEPRESTEYEFLFTKALALLMNNQFSEALITLNNVQMSYPDKKDNKDLKGAVITPIRSFLSFEDYRSHDTDKIDIHTSTLKGRYFITPESGLILDIHHEVLHEPRMNGLQTLDNHAYIWNNYQEIGFFSQLCPELRLEAIGGTMQIQDRSTYGAFNVKASIRPLDRMFIDLQIGRKIFAVSPKAVSYAIRQTYKKVDIVWEPFTRIFIAGQGEYHMYSDGNRSGLSRISPRVGIIRRQYLNFDVGCTMDWLHYSWAPVPYHGYWTPHLHRTFQFTTLAYYKDSNNIAYTIGTGSGVHKDETMATYAFAGDITAQAILGIYCDWNLVISSSATIRINSSMFNATTNTNYRAYNFSAILTRRF